jgi:GNAT superfamily N-acetyltransferase
MIRPFLPQDKETYLSMSVDFYNNTNACLHEADTSHFEATFDACVAGNPYAKGVMIFTEDGQAAGFGLISLTWSNEAGGLCVLLEELYFRPEHRGKGLGTQFFRWVEEAYPDAKRFRLEVTRVNEGAIRLYHALGYEDLDYLQMVKDKV